MKKLKALWNMFKWFWIWFFVFYGPVLVMTILDEGHILELDGNMQNNLTAIWFPISIIIIIVVRGLKTRCPRCKRRFALEYQTDSVTGTEKIKLPKDQEIKNRYGEKTGMFVQTSVDGTRTSYDKVYRCKFCGHKVYRSYYKDKADY